MSDEKEQSTGQKIFGFLRGFFVNSLKSAWSGIVGSINSFSSLLEQFNIGKGFTDLKNQIIGGVGGLIEKADKSRSEAIKGAQAAIEQYFEANQAAFANIDADVMDEIKAQMIERAKAFIDKADLKSGKSELAYANSLEFRDELKLLLVGDKTEKGLLPVGMANRDAEADKIAFMVSGMNPGISSDAKAADLLAAQPTGGLAGMLAMIISAFSADGFDEKTYSGSAIAISPVNLGTTPTTMPSIPTMPQNMMNTNPQTTTGPTSVPVVPKTATPNLDIPL